MKIKADPKDVGSLILRVSFGTLMITLHGWNRLSLLISGKFDNFPDPLGIGPLLNISFLVFAQFFCPILVLIGFKVKYTALPTLMFLLAALFLFHAGDPLADRELAMVYSSAYLSIYFLGSGKYSLDRYLPIT